MRYPRVTEATREAVLYDAHWQCQFPGCYRSAIEVAHCIAKTEANASMIRRMWRELFGEDITLAHVWAHVLNHRLNLRASCRVHNDNFNVGNNPGKCWEILKAIRQAR